MTLKEFKKLPVPSLEFEIVQKGYVLVQVFADRPKESSIILTDEVKNKITEIRNVFRVLSDSDKFKAGDIVALQDALVEPPIIGMKHSVGNDPNKPERPEFGNPLDAIARYSFDCSKSMEYDYKLDLVYLIPEEFITVKFK